MWGKNITALLFSNHSATAHYSGMICFAHRKQVTFLTIGKKQLLHCWGESRDHMVILNAQMAMNGLETITRISLRKRSLCRGLRFPRIILTIKFLFQFLILKKINSIIFCSLFWAEMGLDASNFVVEFPWENGACGADSDFSAKYW